MKSETASNHSDEKYKNKTCPFTISKINLFRILTSSILSIVIAIGGYGSYYVLRNIENDTIYRQFDSYSGQIQNEVQKYLVRNVLASNAISKIYADKCPRDSDWPNCLLELDFLEAVAIDIFELAALDGFAYSAVITTDQQQDFEDFIYEQYGQYGVGQSSFGKGIYGLSIDKGGPDYRYKVVNGSFGQPYLAPLVQLTDFRNLAPAIVLYDEYSEYIRYLALNEMRACVEAKESKTTHCSILSEIITFPASLTQPASDIPPKSLLFTSVQPKISNSSVATGAIITGVEWSAVISGIIPHDINGIECIIAVNGLEYIFEIKNGDGAFKKQRESRRVWGTIDCKHCIPLQYFDGTSVYYLYIKRTDVFDRQYRSWGPVIASVIFVVMIVILSVIFFAYDAFVNKEIFQKEIILNTKQLFVRYISHEIRTPINTIHVGISLLFSEMRSALQDTTLQTDVSQKIKYWLDMIFDIETSSASAIQVLNDLLDYEQIQISKLNMDVSMISVWSICENVFWSFRYNLETKRIKYALHMQIMDEDESKDSSVRVFSSHRADSVDIEEGEAQMVDRKEFMKKLVVMGDLKKIEQVMRNLISNAIKFTPSGGQLMVDVSWVPGDDDRSASPMSIPLNSMLRKNLTTSNGVIKVSVSDTGEGMTPEQQERVFNEGVQFDANRLQDGKGSGLGLWISKGIIEEHKGHIYVESKGIGHGTTFTFELPCYYDETFSFVPYNKAHTVNDANTRVTKQKDIKHVLVVDDSVPNVKVVKRLLANAGYTCQYAYNGMECLEKLERDDYHTICDLVIIDNHMPLMDGPAAVKEIRKRKYDVAVIGLTGSITPDELEHFMSFGCDDVLSKPLNIQKLNETIDALDKSVPPVVSDLNGEAIISNGETETDSEVVAGEDIAVPSYRVVRV